MHGGADHARRFAAYGARHGGDDCRCDLGGGVYASSGNNRIFHNGRFNIYHRNSQPLSALNNFWGTTDPASIGALIYDHADDASLGTVDASGYILPVELTTFTAQARAEDGAVALHWTTATEVNNAGFGIERRNDLVSADATPASSRWTEVGFVDGHGTSAAAHEYAFTDRVKEGSFAYRLKQIDQDGTIRYSSMQHVSVTAPCLFRLEQNYPNPFNPSTSFAFSLPEKSMVTLTIYDLSGRKAAVILSEELSAGTHTLQWNASGLASGLYFYRLQAGRASIARSLLLLK